MIKKEVFKDGLSAVTYQVSEEYGDMLNLLYKMCDISVVHVCGAQSWSIRPAQVVSGFKCRLSLYSSHSQAPSNTVPCCT